MSRSQVSQQLVYLLKQTGVLGGSTSAFESTLPVEGFLASGFAFPIACVQTLEARVDPRNPRRIESARFLIGVAGGAVTETASSNYLASGGSGSSQRTLEATIAGLLNDLNTGFEGLFTNSGHGFQGYVFQVKPERLVTAQAKTFSVAEIEVVVTNCTLVDSYDAPRHFAAAAGSSHSIDLSWTNPATRFDQYQNVLRRGVNAGDAAPSTPTGGTGVTITGGVLGTSANDGGHSAGQAFNYALFRLYTKSTPGDQSSSATTASETTT